MTKRILWTTALAVCSAAPAFAGALIFDPAPEPVVAAPAPMAPAAPQPTWTGPFIGAQVGWGRTTFDETPLGDFDDDGEVYGAQLGYDVEFGGFVLGGELSYLQAELEPDEEDIELERAVRLLGRGGFSLGRTLIYAKGGGAWLDGTTGDDGADDLAWVAGGGVEHLVTDSISAGLEYLYHHKNNFGDEPDIDVTLQTVTLRVNFRF